MQNIPAKVIGFIGMDNGVFPRSQNRANFDLIAKNPQQGDRLPDKDDRQLFLEYIIAARQGLYFSYVGQSNRKEVEFPPSVVLRELIDYITEKYQIEERSLVYEHPLQAFSPAYFKQENEKLFSYSGKNRIISNQLAKTDIKSSTFFKSKLPKPDKAFQSLSVGDFTSFFQHPAKFLMQQRLNIYFQNDAVIDDDCEPFELNALEKYNIGQDLLNRFLYDQPLKGYEEVAQAQNLLPEDWPGQQILNQQVAEVQQYGHFIEHIFDQEKLSPGEVDCNINNFQITGRLNQIYENEQLLYRFGNMRPKDLIELWIKHLLFQAVKPEHHSGRSKLITRDKKSPAAIFELSPCADAQNILSNLLAIYWKGLQENTLFFPKASFEYAQALLLKQKDERKALQMAEKKWLSGDYNKFPKEGDDPYNKRIMEDNNPFEDNKLQTIFKDVSRAFWKPFFEVLTDV
jgi:exodeoxyribonuclease V gamma subunit